MGLAAALSNAVIGRPFELPRELTGQYPELSDARWRRGGIFVRVGGWFLGEASVAAITLWRTIWIAPGVNLTAELLLHELRHVHQFEASPTFPVRYLWETLRRGYVGNRFEVDARAYAAQRVRQTSPSAPSSSTLNG